MQLPNVYCMRPLPQTEEVYGSLYIALVSCLLCLEKGFFFVNTVCMARYAGLSMFAPVPVYILLMVQF